MPNPPKAASIQQSQEAVEATLANLRKFSTSDPAYLQALDLLSPAGFRPVVTLFEDCRKKRRTASARNWSPATGEIRISFKPSSEEKIPAAAVIPAADRRVTDLLNALDEAETAPGWTFVALKRFRDDFLPAKGFPWARTPEERQAVLAQAIQNGWVLTSKVQNPKAPLYPTTTIRLNRQKRAQLSTSPAARFRPVPIVGEPLSSTVLRDRGSR